MSDSTLASISSSNMSAPQKSALRSAFDRAMGGGRLAKAKRHAIETAHTVRGAAEVGLISAGLGAVNASLPNGLDYIVKPAQAAGTVPQADGTLSPAKEAITVPIDGIVALAGLGGSILLAGESDGISGSGVSSDCRNVGLAALSVLAFRKTHDAVAMSRKKAGKPSGGTLPSAKAQIHAMMQAQTPAAHGETSGFGYENDPIVALGVGSK